MCRSVTVALQVTAPSRTSQVGSGTARHVANPGRLLGVDCSPSSQDRLVGQRSGAHVQSVELFRASREQLWQAREILPIT